MQSHSQSLAEQCRFLISQYRSVGSPDLNMSQSLPSTLSTQDGPLQPSNTDNPNQAGSPMEAAVADIEPVTPVKRGPGRPKGSGMKNKFVDPNAPPPVKRPVGRPRKDGLPAGSVPRPASINTRKRKVAAPGSFAASPTNSYHQTTASASAPPFTVVRPLVSLLSFL